MARTQAKIVTSIWTDPDWLALSSAAQRLYLMLLSQPKLTIAGCLDVMPARWARLSPDTDEAGILEALEELSEARYVVIDGDELIIRTFVSHDLGAGTLNSNLVKGMWSAWAGILSPTLRAVVVAEMPARVYDREGVDVPEEARKLRFPPLSEPRSEPSVDLLPVPFSLKTATDTYLRTTPVAIGPVRLNEVAPQSAAERDDELNRSGIAAARAARKAAAS